MSETKCGRCGEAVKTHEAEICWWCKAQLCGDCWEEYGHCGHLEADAINNTIAQIRKSEDDERHH